jgi:hypothetical protein
MDKIETYISKKTQRTMKMSLRGSEATEAIPKDEIASPSVRNDRREVFSGEK